MTDPLDLDAVGQAELVAAGQISTAELVDLAIERIEARNPTINAVIHERFDAARTEAAGDLPAGPFRGVPFLVKDGVCAQAGEPFHAGMQLLKDHDHRASEDQWLLQRYRDAGFVILGRTNLPELALEPTTEPVAYGPTQNPAAPGRTPGGSSGGSAAAVADGWVAAAHGNDMGGSIRMPAACCGIVGLKPSRGRTTLGPAFGEYWGQMTHEHVLCRSVRDTAAILDATAGPGPGDPYTAPPPTRPWAEEVGADPGRLRVGVLTSSPLRPTDPACVEGARKLADRLADLGHDVVESAPGAMEEIEYFFAYGTIFNVHVASELARIERLLGIEIGEGDVEAVTWESAEAGRAIDAVSYWEAIEALHAWSRRQAGWFVDHDLLVTPMLSTPPPPLGQVDTTAMIPFAIPFDVSGQPAISLPTHEADGLPIGVQLAAGYGREDRVIAAASQVHPDT